MTKLDFPDTPSTGQQFGSSGTVWRWDGTRWGSTAGASGARGQVAIGRQIVNQTVAETLTTITGLTVSFTANPTRTYKVTAHVNVESSSLSPTGVQGFIYSGSTAITEGSDQMPHDQWGGGQLRLQTIVTGWSGAITLDVKAKALTTANYYTKSSVAPAFLLVEDITYEAGTGGPTNDSFVLKTGDTMSGHLNGITPVAAANLTRKDYVDKNYWNSAWGSYGRTQVNVDQPIYGAETPLHGGASNFPFTPVAGRYYRFCLAFETFGSCATFFRAYFANVQYYVWALNTPAGEQTHELFSPPFALPAAGGTVGYTHIWRAGSGCTIQAAGFQGTFTWIEDIGPVTRQ